MQGHYHPCMFLIPINCQKRMQSIYRITGLVQEERWFFRFLLEEQNPEKRQLMGERFFEKTIYLKKMLNHHHISIRQLSVKNRAALLNIEGWSHVLLNRNHLFLQIHQAFQRALREVVHLSHNQVFVRFRASEQISHRMEMQHHFFILQPSLAVVSFPEEYFYHLGLNFFYRYANRPIPPETSQILIKYELSHLPSPAPTLSVSTDPYLSKLFQKLNKRYFQGMLSQPNLQWSPHRSIRRLGYMNHRKNLLVLSRCLRNQEVPEYVREGIMYHEMLHLVHRVQLKNGKRIHHTRQFKQDEPKFEHYQQLKKWVQTELPRLARKWKQRK